MDSDNKNKDDKKFIVLSITIIIYFVGVAIWYFSYPLQENERTISNFIFIFLRELIIAGFITIMLVFGAVIKIRKFFQKD